MIIVNNGRFLALFFLRENPPSKKNEVSRRAYMLAIKKGADQRPSTHVMFQLPDGNKIGHRTLKGYRKTVLKLKEDGLLSIEQCEAMLDGLPHGEASYIKAALRRCMMQVGESPEVYFWDWVMALVVHTLQRYRGNKPTHGEPGKIRLWRESTPVDLFAKIRLEGTAIGTLIAQSK